MKRLILVLLLIPALLLSQEQAVKPFKIIIDAGHGGTDSGADGLKGAVEKDVTLEMALLLKKSLEDQADPALKVFLTRTEDKFVPLIERVGFANQAEGDFFLSLHMNASPSKRDNGFESYYYDSTGTSESSEVAKRENEQEGAQEKIDKNNPLFILWDLAQNEFIKDSSVASDCIQEMLDIALNKNGDPSTKMHNRGVKQADFLVLNGMKMPSVLLEMGFITNKDDAEKFKQKEFKEKYAAAMADALRQIKARIEKNNGTGKK